MSHLDNKLQWCLKKGKEEGRKHRGLREIKPTMEEAMRHMTKARHNLNATSYLIRGNYSDWAVSTSFYAMYHCLLAILAKHGYESRNQECTMAAVQMLIDKKKLKLEIKWLKKIGTVNDTLNEEDMITLREEFQYGTKMLVEKKRLDEIVRDTKEFFELVKTILK